MSSFETLNDGLAVLCNPSVQCPSGMVATKSFWVVHEEMAVLWHCMIPAFMKGLDRLDEFQTEGVSVFGEGFAMVLAIP